MTAAAVACSSLIYQTFSNDHFISDHFQFPVCLCPESHLLKIFNLRFKQFSDKYCDVLDSNSSEFMRKLCLPTKFPHQKLGEVMVFYAVNILKCVGISTVNKLHNQSFFSKKQVCCSLKDTHREKALSNKTPALTKSRSIDILVVGTSN